MVWRAAALVLLLLPFGASAAILPVEGVNFRLTAKPENPRPGQLVTISILSWSPDAERTAYTWTVNGKIVDQGIGKTAITIPAGALGSTLLINANAEGPNGQAGSARIVLRPADIDIIYEGKTIVPPLYIGRSLPNANSLVTLVAIPSIVSQGDRIDARDLVYEWKINNTVQKDKSGYGKYFSTLAVPGYGQQFTVSVRAETFDHSAAAEKTITIDPVDPLVVVYEQEPLSGVLFNKSALKTYTLQKDEVVFVSYPLYINSYTNLSYEWLLNGKPLPTPANGPRLSLKKQGAGASSRAVSMIVTESGKTPIRAITNFDLQF